MKTPIKIIIIFLSAAIVGYGGTYLFEIVSGDNENGYVEPENEVPTVTGRVHEPEKGGIVSVLVPKDSTKLVVNKPLINTSDIRVSLVVGYHSYSYNVSGIYVEGGSGYYSYRLYDDVNSYTNEDGRFSNVPANANGIYTLVVTDMESNQTSESCKVTGFMQQYPIGNIVTCDELTGMIMTGDWDGNKNKLNGRIRNNITIKCSNTDFGKKTIQEVFMAVMLEGWKVEVAAVSHDCLGKLYAVTLNASK